MAPPARAIPGPGTFKVTPSQESEWTWEGAYERDASQSTRELFSLMTEGPAALEGRRVRKKFGTGWFEGEVSAVDSKGIDGVGNALVTYSDGDEEHLDFDEIYPILIPRKEGKPSAKRKRKEGTAIQVCEMVVRSEIRWTSRLERRAPTLSATALNTRTDPLDPN